MTGIFLQAFQQLTGINFIFYFGTRFSQAALPNSNPFIFSVVYNVVNVVSTVPGMYMMERLGRRQLLIWGAVWMCLCELIVAVVGTTVPTSNTAGGKTLVAFVCVYIAGFAAPGVLPLGSSAVRSSPSPSVPRLSRSALPPTGSGTSVSATLPLTSSTRPGQGRSRHQGLLHLDRHLRLLCRLCLLLCLRDPSALARGGRRDVRSDHSLEVEQGQRRDPRSPLRPRGCRRSPQGRRARHPRREEALSFLSDHHTLSRIHQL